ncbi:MAG: hypothetical protein COA73_10400 [Candidatus Hydrogenedentota bacterium]|nr:MAG: hypothetical protein COA73_10400 [Candidatus Hydrogenedentota bacterium]
MKNHVTFLRDQEHLMTKHRLLIGIVIFCSTFSISSLGQDSEPKGALTLTDALELTLRQSPDLSTFEWDSRIAEARRLQASYRPNPELSFEIEEIRLTDGPDSISTFGDDREVEDGGSPGLSDAEYTLSISQLVELGGKRLKRIRSAELEGDVFHREYEIARADVLAETAILFTMVLGAQDRLQLAEETLLLTTDIAKAISARVTAGQVSPIEEKRSDVQVSQARIAFEREQRTLDAARILLAASWGSENPQFSHALGALDAVVPTKSANELKAIVTNNPDLRFWTSELNRLDSLVVLEKAQRRPDLGVTVGYRARSLNSRSTSNFDLGANPQFIGNGRSGFSGSREDTFVLEFSVPLKIFNRNKGRIRESEYQVLKAGAMGRAAETRIRSQIDSIYESLKASENEMAGLKTEVLPKATSAYNDINKGYIAGKFGYLEVLDAQRTLVDARVQYLNALVFFHQDRIILERLAGIDISAMPNAAGIAN